MGDGAAAGLVHAVWRTRYRKRDDKIRRQDSLGAWTDRHAFDRQAGRRHQAAGAIAEERIRNGCPPRMARKRRRRPTARFPRSSKRRCAISVTLATEAHPARHRKRDRRADSPAAQSTIPDVPVLFWSFRIMVALGFYFIALFGVAFYLASRRCGKPWFLRL